MGRTCSLIGGPSLTKDCPYGELSTACRYRGAPKKRYKDCLKKSHTACHGDPSCRSDMAADRDTWRYSIFNVIDMFEEDRKMNKKTGEAKGKRELRQAPHWTLLSPVSTAHEPAIPA